MSLPQCVRCGWFHNNACTNPPLISCRKLIGPNLHCDQPVNHPVGAHSANTLGRKDDIEKDRWDLLPESIESVIAVLTYGAKKYGPENWRAVVGAKPRYFAATMRHLFAYYFRNEALDKESGLPHLAHAACCVLFLLAIDNGRNNAKP